MSQQYMIKKVMIGQSRNPYSSFNGSNDIEHTPPPPLSNRPPLPAVAGLPGLPAWPIGPLPTRSRPCSS
jgi:hypothetical protein